MFNKKLVKKALKRTLVWDNITKKAQGKAIVGQDKEISLLIHDIFGGEILKTPWKKGWHFYNRIKGERLDLSLPEKSKLLKSHCFLDIPSNPDETNRYVAQVDYSRFYMNFIRTFEEIIGLKYTRPVYTS